MPRFLQRAPWALLALLLWTLLLPAARADEPPPPANDDELRALVEQAGTAEDNDGADVVTVFHRTEVRVEESGLSHVHEHVLLKCLTEKGAAELARLRFDWDPASNAVDVQRVRVLRADGAVDVVPPERVLDVPQPQWAIYWGARMKLVPLPRLHPGDAVEFETEMKGFLIAYLDGTGEPAAQGTAGPGGAAAPAGEVAPGDERYVPPMRGHFYDVVTFQERGRPVKLRLYRVTLPADKPLRYEVYNGELASAVVFDEQGVTYSFWKRDLPAYEEEPRAVEFPDVATKVVLTTVPDWPAKSRWFYEVNQHQFESTPEIRALVEELTRGLRSDEERVHALVHWAADEIRYSGISMGEGEGYTLHPGSMVFHDRCGVCKDKASMALTLLRAAGYEVYPAMTEAGSRVERVPADQFNHCVVAWRRADGSWTLLDPTWVPFSQEDWSSAEGEQDYLIGTPEGEELRRTPAFRAEDNALLVEDRSRLLPDGTLEGTLVFQGRGYADQRLRRELVHYSTARGRQHVFASWLSGLDPRAELVEPVRVDYAAIRDISRPLRLELHYRVPGYARAQGDLLVFAPPLAHHLVTSGRLAPYLDAAGAEERSQGLLLWAPRMRVATERLQLPPGYELVSLPADRSIEREAASLETRAELRGRSLRYRFTLEVPRREVPVEAYPGFREVVQAALDLPAEPVVLRRKP